MEFLLDFVRRSMNVAHRLYKESQFETFICIALLYWSTMAYFCPFCGQEAYRGHRDYKCDNEECENHEQPVFTLRGKPIDPDSVQDDPDSLSRHGVDVSLGVEASE